MSLVVYLQATSGEKSHLEAIEFVIDRPENIEQVVFDDEQFGRVVGRDSEETYVTDVTIQNSGNQAAVIAEFSVEFTQVFEPDICGSPGVGGGGGLYVSGSYDIEFDDLATAAELPVQVTRSTRLEVPGHEHTRIDLRIGPKYKPVGTFLQAYAFSVYIREAGSDQKVLLGNGKSLASSKDAATFLDMSPDLALASASCMRENAEQISRMAALPGATSPALAELAAALTQYK